MKNCNTLRIYKFDFSLHKSKMNVAKKQPLLWARAKEQSELKLALIKEFSGTTPDELFKEYGFGSLFEKGMELVKEKEGIQTENQWYYFYIGVPKTNVRALQFMEEHIPSWVTTVKKI